MAISVLIVEDDRNIQELLQLYLEKEGYAVTVASDGGQGLAKFRSIKPDLVLLDVMMPVMDGWAVCKAIRADSQTPIIMLTAKGETDDKVTGLKSGADDYVTKPFNPIVLGAKVKAQIRRSKGSLHGAEAIAVAGPFRYNTTTLRFYKNETEVVLSSKENAIIKLFMDNVNRIFP